MLLSIPLANTITSLLLAVFTTLCQAQSLTEVIIKNALADGIDLEALPFAAEALKSIEALRVGNASKTLDFSNATRVDTHVHVVPDFYRNLKEASYLSPPLPKWDPESHLKFMINNSINHGIVSISTPGSTMFQGNATASIGIARLLNEYMAQLVAKYPEHLSFFAVTPLPYVTASIKEAKYALATLKARGLGLLTNHEGIYPGDAAVTPFWSALNSTAGGPHVIFIHPNPPVLRTNSNFVSAVPGTPPHGDWGEFYFETARAIMDLTLSQTLANFTNIHYAVSHCGGSFPSTIDRVLDTGPESIETEAKAAYKSQIWYDSAGPTYPRQVQGLLAYVPKSQLLFGTDYPFNPIISRGIQGLENTTFLTKEELEGVFSKNIEGYLGGKL